VSFNPPSSQLGTANAVVSGTSQRYSTRMVEGWLSIKSVMSGSAVWETAERSITVEEGCCLLLNDRHPYALHMDSPQPVTTFCLFFARGFVEEVDRCVTTPSERLLDQPQPGKAASLTFLERVEPEGSPLEEQVRAFRRRCMRGFDSSSQAEEWFLRVARQLVRSGRQTGTALARLPALRASTRQELYRRVLRGRDFLLGAGDQRVRLEDAARAACLSPFHFHRSFTQAFGQSPHDFLTRHRLDRARKLLLSTDLSVTDVCLEVGFTSLGSFSTLFRRNFGASPRELRRARGGKM
jgi:AraC family transcriptional regulator